MFATFLRTIKFWFAMLLIALLVLFAVVNREVIDLSLFPLPYEVSLPKFLIAIICFGAGLIVGGLLMSIRLTQAVHDRRREHQRSTALENEVKSLQGEHHALPN